jgi:hypothetical protein
MRRANTLSTIDSDHGTTLVADREEVFPATDLLAETTFPAAGISPNLGGTFFSDGGDQILTGSAGVASAVAAPAVIPITALQGLGAAPEHPGAEVTADQADTGALPTVAVEPVIPPHGLGAASEADIALAHLANAFPFG